MVAFIRLQWTASLYESVLVIWGPLASIVQFKEHR